MFTGLNSSPRLFWFVVCLFVAVGSANADKNNKFYVSLERYQGNAGAYFNRGSTELDKGNLAGAQQAFTAAIKADGALWQGYLMRAQIYMAQGKYQSALQDINQAAHLKPQFTRTFITRAEIYGALGRCAEGITDLDKVISIHSTPESVAFALSTRAMLRARCHNSVHDPKKAVEDALKACNTDGWHMADYIDTLALAYASGGDYNSAIKYEKQAIDSGRFTPEELKYAQSRLAYYQRQQKH